MCVPIIPKVPCSPQNSPSRISPAHSLSFRRLCAACKEKAVTLDPNAHQPPRAKGGVTLLRAVRCWPDRNKSISNLCSCLTRLCGGYNTISLCQCIVVAKLLGDWERKGKGGYLVSCTTKCLPLKCGFLISPNPSESERCGGLPHNRNPRLRRPRNSGLTAQGQKIFTFPPHRHAPE